MKIDIQMDDKNLQDLLNIRQKIDQALFLAGNELRNEIVLNKLSGNPVHRRTGNLANSIAVKRNSNGIEVGSFGVSYAKTLEYSDKFKKYRWLKPSLIDAADKMKAAIKRFLEGGASK